MNVDYKLKRKFNYYNSSKIGSNIQSLSAIAKKNTKFAPIYEYLQNYSAEYDKQLEIVKTELQKLSSDLEGYSLVYISRSIKRIKQNFNQLDKQIEKFKSVNLDTGKYWNHLNRIITDLYKIINEINDFNDDNLIFKNYKHLQFLVDINNELKDLSMKLNSESNNIDNEIVHKKLLNMFFSLNKYYEISSNLFNIETHSKAFESILLNTKAAIESIDDSMSDRKIDFFHKTKTYVDNSKLFKKSINEKNSQEIVAKFINEIKRMENDLKEIKKHAVYVKILKENKELFDENVDNLLNIIEEKGIEKHYRIILTKFKNNKKLIEIANKNIQIIQEIQSSLEIYFNLQNDQHAFNKNKKTVELILSIYRLMLEFKYNNDEIYNVLESDNKKVFDVILRTNDCIIKLTKIEKLAIENKYNNKEFINDLELYKNKISQINDFINKDFNLIDDNVITELNSIECFINNSIFLIKNQMQLIEVVRFVKMYANKFKNEKNIAEFKAISSLIKQAKYYEALDAYISLITKNTKQKGGNNGVC